MCGTSCVPVGKLNEIESPSTFPFSMGMVPLIELQSLRQKEIVPVSAAPSAFNRSKIKWEFCACPITSCPCQVPDTSAAQSGVAAAASTTATIAIYIKHST